jgi:hypothetical protein
MAMQIRAQSPLIESLCVRPSAEHRDSGVHFVRRFEALTGIRIRKAAVAAIPRPFLGRPVDGPEELAQRYCYELQPRTYNALRQHGKLSRQPWTFGRLLEIRGFGLYSLLDLLEVLAKHSSDLAKPTQQGTGEPV